MKPWFSSGTHRVSHPMLLAALTATLLPHIADGQQTSPKGVPDWLASSREILANEGHALPPAEIRRLVEVPWHLNVAVSQVSPTRTRFLHEQVEEFPSITALGKAHTYFGGLDVDVRANRSRNLTTRSGLAFRIVDAVTGKSVTISAPAKATLSGPAWSPDGQQLAYVANFDDASHVYVADVASGQSTRLTTRPLLATLVTSSPGFW